MKTFSSFLFAIVILISLSSCSSSILVQKTYDPEVILEKKPCTIVFINIFDYTSPAYVRLKHGDAYHAGVMNLAEGLSGFSRDESVSFLTGDTLKKGILPGQLTAFLPKDSILAICKRHNAGLLLSLDSMSVFFDWQTIVDRNNDGSKERTKKFYLYTRFYLSLYSVTGALKNRSKVENSSFYSSNPALTDLITIKPSIAKASKEVGSLGLQAGQDYAGKFYPKTVHEYRDIYAGKVFKESNLFIKLKNWDKATELLDQLAKSPDPNTAMKARHNLSVVKEAANLEK
jgi:Family of unknown function (DUF6340)